MKPNQECDFIQGASEFIGPNKNDAPKWIRCPKCGRRLKPHLRDCHYGISGAEPCWHYTIPPHKKKGWWKKRR